MAILLEFWGQIKICILTSVDVDTELVFQEESNQPF